MKLLIQLFFLTIVSLTCFSQTETPVLYTGKKSSKVGKWIDKSTGHKIEKLTYLEGDNRSFYFHNSPFVKSKDGLHDLMIFINHKNQNSHYYSLNLNTKEVQQITTEDGPKKGEILSPVTREIFYMAGDSVFSTHIDTQVTKFIYEFDDNVVGSITTVNSEGTHLGGALITKEEMEILKKYPEKTGYFDRIYEAKLKRSLITLNISTKKLDTVYSENAWLNHIQFSPTDPDNLMYCHEGPWHKVDRIWNINLSSFENKIIHKRIMDWEIAGHEFFSPDGKTIWYDLQMPRSVTFYLAGKNLETGELTKYSLERDEWSIHYNISPDQKSFAGDGGDPSQVARAKDGMWIYHFVPNDAKLESTRLVNMKNHDYDLEPNVHFSPDGRQVIFRANFEGKTQIYAVDINK